MRLHGTALATLLLLVPIAAMAWEPERVSLRNGGVVRGALVEKVPGDHITLKLATGEIRTIPWQDIAESETPSSLPTMKSLLSSGQSMAMRRMWRCALR